MIAALVGQLALEHPPFPRDRRITWLRMAAMTFDLVYGVEESIAVAPAGGGWTEALAAAARVTPAVEQATAAPAVPKDPARLPRPRAPDQMLVIDLDGVAWGRDAPLALSAVGQGDPIWDFRPGEQGLDNVIWAEPVNGKVPPLTVFKA